MAIRSIDADFFEMRAEQELTAAQDSRHPAVVRAHYELAGLYLDRLNALQPKRHTERERLSEFRPQPDPDAGKAR
ncbi:MAG TPA: hypothetical protein VE567_08775 [Sphingomonas sp.]|nr:hypothetical protein [Sphingomonas sp.]